MYMTRTMPGGEHVDVYLNGEKLTACFAADDVAGWAECAMKSPQGRFMLDRNAVLDAYNMPPAYDLAGGLMTMTRYGKVEFVFDSDEWRAVAEKAQP